MTGPYGDQPSEETVCVRHPDRPTQLRCVRCGRPACPECLREASVGYQCVDCVRATTATTRAPTTVAGAPIRAGRPAVTLVLIALNVLVYFYTAYQAQSVNDNAAHSSLFAALSLYAPAVATGQWWRLLTAGFLHFGILHIALNMISLYIIGREVEVVLGRGRFLALYVVSLFGGGVGAFLFSPLNAQTAGASGAVFGLMGALAVAVFRLRLNPRAVLMVIVLNLVLSFSISGISWQGHVGGLITGVLVMLAMVYGPARYRTAIQLSGTLAVVVLLVALFFVRDAMLTPAVLCAQVPCR